MGVKPGDEPAAELYMEVATIAAVYGDPNGTYAAFMKNAEVQYPSEPYFLWTQPLSDGGWVASNVNSSGGGSGATTPAKENAAMVSSGAFGGLFAIFISVVAVLVIA